MRKSIELSMIVGDKVRKRSLGPIMEGQVATVRTQVIVLSEEGATAEL